jgi:hypothetical protein
LSSIGYNLAYDHWCYRVAYANKTNRKYIRFKLPELSHFLWSLGVFFAQGIAQNLPTILLWEGAKLLYAKYKRAKADHAPQIIEDSEALELLPQLCRWADNSLSRKDRRQLRAITSRIIAVQEKRRRDSPDLEIKFEGQLTVSAKTPPKRSGKSRNMKRPRPSRRMR